MQATRQISRQSYWRRLVCVAAAIALAGCGGGGGGNTGTPPSNATSTASASSSGSSSGSTSGSSSAGGSSSSGSGTSGSGTSTSPSSGTPTPVTIVPGAAIIPAQSQSGGTLVLTVSGSQQGTSYQFLNVSGKATLAGSLVINFVDGFVPQHGQTFTLVTATQGVFGAFDSVVTNDVPFTTGQNAGSFFITVD